MTEPAPERIFEALDATWPAAELRRAGPWLLRGGAGGGQRVSAATALDTPGSQDIEEAERGMAAFGQRPLFMIRPGDGALDAWLHDRNYEIVDPVAIYAVETQAISETFRPSTAIASWPPLAVQKDIWAEGGIGAPRLDVMARAACPKTTILGRAGDRAAGTAYIGVDGRVAMLHALETRASERRKGVGARLTRAAAAWAEAAGARWLTLAVTEANHSANALYAGLGMAVVARYHYRRKRE